jgi:aquaporin Z
MSIGKRIFAECIGTFWLVLGGTGSAVIAAAVPGVGIGLLGVALAFGLTLLTMAYAIGRISGCHINPAVTIGLAVAKKFAWKDVPLYVIFQVIGAIAASAVLYLIMMGKPGFDIAGGLAANGYGVHSPGGYAMLSGVVSEVVLTFMFILVILKVTEKAAPAGFAAIPIGLMLTLIHLISIPITNTSVNPARSTGPALIAGLFGGSGGWALGQLWFFWVFPIVGAVLAGIVYKALKED